MADKQPQKRVSAKARLIELLSAKQSKNKRSELKELSTLLAKMQKQVSNKIKATDEQAKKVEQLVKASGMTKSKILEFLK